MISDVHVSCDIEANIMTVDVQFEQNFNGLLFAKGYYKTERCRVAADGGKHHRIALPLDLCGTEIMKTVSKCV